MTPILRLYNTFTRTKEPFVPIDPSNVRMYACGPTVYDDAHIGNARPIIVFDLLFRLLRHLYGPDHVTYVRNVTDVDDKINARAAERGVSIRELTDGTLQRFHEDIRALGVLMPEDVNEPGKPRRFVEPRATDHIEEMKALIEPLVASGHAYVAEDHVLFHVPSMPDYGALSRRPLHEMEAGARVDVAPYKRSPLDFVLWKPSDPRKTKMPLPGWPSPCNIGIEGRPGWHIECSAMSWHHLGEVFDIHAGGIDLLFPHHENEIAQSRCAFHTPAMANYWLHNGFLQVEGEKMAKSAGNFVTIRELLTTDRFGGRSWPGEVLRLAMLRTHYRQPVDWTIQNLQESLRIWISFGNAVRDHMKATTPDRIFLAALADDLNTPAALTRLFELRDQATRGDQASGRSLTASLRMLGFFEGAFGVRTQITIPEWKEALSPDEFIPTLKTLSKDTSLHEVADRLATRAADSGRAAIEFLRRFSKNTTTRDYFQTISGKPSELDRLHENRKQARAAKNWAEADRIRDELAARGVRLKDNKDGTTTWEVAQ